MASEIPLTVFPKTQYAIAKTLLTHRTWSNQACANRQASFLLTGREGMSLKKHPNICSSVETSEPGYQYEHIL